MIRVWGTGLRTGNPRSQDMHGSSIVVGMSTKEHLVQNQSQSPDIGWRTDFFCLPLLRGHVGRRPFQPLLLTNKGSLRIEVLNISSSPLPESIVSGSRRSLRKTKIQNPQPTITGQHDVVGLEVSVEDFFFMSSSERLGDGFGDSDRFFDTQPLLLQSFSERLPFQVFQGDVGATLRQYPRCRWSRCWG